MHEFDQSCRPCERPRTRRAYARNVRVSIVLLTGAAASGFGTAGCSGDVDGGGMTYPEGTSTTAPTTTTTTGGGTGGMEAAAVTSDGGPTTTSSGAGGTGVVAPTTCDTPHPNRAPMRRLTRFEYNSTVNALLGDATFPA